MNSEPIPVRAPQGAVAWSPDGGYVYHVADLPTEVGPGHYALHVNRDGVINIPATQMAPLAALLRVDADVSELVHRIADTETEEP